MAWKILIREEICCAVLIEAEKEVYGYKKWHGYWHGEVFDLETKFAFRRHWSRRKFDYQGKLRDNGLIIIVIRNLWSRNVGLIIVESRTTFVEVKILSTLSLH